MSKYHPLDVRHPSNRRYLHKNYLLYPPAPIETRYAQGTPARRGRSLQRDSDVLPVTAQSPTQAPAQSSAAAPWGGTAPGAAVGRAAGGFGGTVRLLFFVGIIAVVIGAQSELFAPLLRQLRVWAFEMGLALPF